VTARRPPDDAARLATLLTETKELQLMLEPDPPHRWQETFVTIIAALSGAWTLAVGLWALLAPRSFADWIDFPPYAEHLLHDVGAFQIGIGLSLLAALAWSDAKSVALLGFGVAGVIHTVNHTIDLDLGGHSADVWLIGASTVLAGAALVVRFRTVRNRRTSGQAT
jgi:hypothetical protein